MSNTDEKKPGSDQGNAIENETREAESVDDDFAYDDEGRPLKKPDAASEVTEEDSKLADEHSDDDEFRGKKF